MLSRFFDIERCIHSLKTGIACIVGLLFSRLIGFPADQWVVITIIVVMCAQIYVGSVLQKAYLRFIGTCLGCLFAIFAIELMHHTLFTLAITIGVSSFLFSYIAVSQDRFSYAGTLGAVTTAIILLGQEPTIGFAFERFMEISVGILIATLISQYVLPIHARTHLRRTQASTLTQLRDLYITAMSTRSDTEAFNYIEPDEFIVKSLTKQRQLAKESTHESRKSAFDLNNFMHSFYCEKEILRSFDFMHHAIRHVDNAKNNFFQSEKMHEFNEKIVQALNTLIKVIETGKPEQEHIHLPSLNALKQTATENFYIDGFLFAAEILQDNLEKLAVYYHIKVLRDE